MAKINNLKRKIEKITGDSNDIAISIDYGTHVDLTINGAPYMNISHQEKEELLSKYKWNESIEIRSMA